MAMMELRHTNASRNQLHYILLQVRVHNRCITLDCLIDFPKISSFHDEFIFLIRRLPQHKLEKF